MSVAAVPAPKPKMRGWLHAVMAPVSAVAGIILVATAPSTEARIASAIFALTSVLLFTTSALLHRGRWSPRTESMLRRMDHANIYLIIAGSYTPFAMLALPPQQGATLLWIVWVGAAAGVFFRIFWLAAPRWLYTGLYVVIGWVAVFFLPGLIDGAGALVVVLLFAGGLLYTIGAVVYGLRRPDPSPAWFGFHEVFHSFTVAAYLTHFVAIWIVVHA